MDFSSECDKLVLDAFCAKVLIAIPETGEIYGSRWRIDSNRGFLNVNGYVVFTLHFNGRRAQIKAHRAIWLFVNGKIPNGLFIDHINRKRSDNRIANLRLADAKLNAENRRRYAGSNNPSSKINENIAYQIRIRYAEIRSYAKVAVEFDLSKSLIAKIVRDEIWK